MCAGAAAAALAGCNAGASLAAGERQVLLHYPGALCLHMPITWMHVHHQHQPVTCFGVWVLVLLLVACRHAYKQTSLACMLHSEGWSLEVHEC